MPHRPLDRAARLAGCAKSRYFGLTLGEERALRLRDKLVARDTR